MRFLMGLMVLVALSGCGDEGGEVDPPTTPEGLAQVLCDRACACDDQCPVVLDGDEFRFFGDTLTPPEECLSSFTGSGTAEQNEACGGAILRGEGACNADGAYVVPEPCNAPRE